MSMKSPLHSNHAPEPIGPYTQAMRAGDFVFISGQIGINPNTGKISAKTAADQATQCLRNIRAILTAAGLNAGHVVKTTIFLANMDDFTKVNEAYGEFFHDDPPARSTVQVAKLPMDALVEIEAIAMRRPEHTA
jgi:2-iminobutanoate/2-iminopropanoate deaminase